MFQTNDIKEFKTQSIECKGPGRSSRQISSGISHSDVSCILGRIHSDTSWNLRKKVYHTVTKKLCQSITHFLSPNLQY